MKNKKFKIPKRGKIKEGVDWPITNDDGTVYQIKALHAQNDIIAMMLAGRGWEEIDRFVLEKYGWGEERSRQMRQEAEIQIIKRKQWELGSTIDLHLARYEEIYAKLVELGATNAAATALRNKEKVLQFHKQGTHLKVVNNNITQISIRNQKTGFDIEKLEPERRERFLELMEKTDYKR